LYGVVIQDKKRKREKRGKEREKAEWKSDPVI